METQIIILLLFVLRTVSSQNVNIPPAPTLPNLDVSSFPDYMQRLLTNRPSLIYVNKPNHHEASNGNGDISSDHVNTQTGENIGMARTNVMDPMNNRRYSLDKINNVQSKPLFLPQGLRKPHTYGMNLRGDKGEIWNDFSGTHLYINDFAPSKSYHPYLLHNKEDEPKSVSINNNVITPKHNDDDYNQKLSVTIKPATLYATPLSLPENVAAIRDEKEQYNQQLPSIITTENPEMFTTLIPEISKTTSEEMPSVQKDKTVNQFSENIPSISKLARDVIYYMSPQSLSEEIPANVDQQDNSAANPTVNEISTEVPKENIVNTSEKHKVVQSFSDNNSTVIPNKEIMNNRSPKTFGMKLIGDHGYVWNDLTRPSFHYNVGELDSTNLTSEKETNPFNSTNIAEESSIEKTKPETFHIYNPTTETNNTNGEEELTKNISSEIGGFLKMYIEKLVKEELARQPEQNNTTTDAYRNNGSENKKPIANVENSNGENHYGSLIGNGKVTNIFVFYPNDKNIKSTVDDTTILSKPVNEILNDMLKKNTNSNASDEKNNLTTEPTESPDTTITTEPIKQDNNSNKDKGIEKYKDNETTTQSTAVTSEINLTTVDSTTTDKGNQTTQTSTSVQDDATKAKTSENTTVTVTESSEDDITNPAVTENNSKNSTTESSLQEIDINNEPKQAKSVTNEEAESTTNTEEPKITNDSMINSSIGTSNEDADKSSNETQITLYGKQTNEEAELTTISNSAEVGNTVTSKDNATIDGTTTAEPAQEITTDIVSANDSSDVKDDIDAASSDITLPNSDS